MLICQRFSISKQLSRHIHNPKHFVAFLQYFNNFLKSSNFRRTCCQNFPWITEIDRILLFSKIPLIAEVRQTSAGIFWKPKIHHAFIQSSSWAMELEAIAISTCHRSRPSSCRCNDCAPAPLRPLAPKAGPMFFLTKKNVWLIFGKLWEARSRLYRSQILQANIK